ncbi:MAG: hypothetical protein P1V35_11625 [Planctomycetota bacterium]|nr:hypothetical protein [Planctomycetota bacterium]
MFVFLLLVLGVGFFWGGGASEALGVEMVEGESTRDEVAEAKENLVPIGTQEDVRVSASGLVEFVPEVRAGLDEGNSFTVLVKDRSGRALPGYPLRICRGREGGGFERAGPLATHFALSDDSGVARFGLDTVAELNGKGFVLSGLEWKPESFLGLTLARIRQGHVNFTVTNGGSLGVKLVNSPEGSWRGGERVYAEGEGWRRYSMRAQGGWHWMHDLPLGVKFNCDVLGRGQALGKSRVCLAFVAGEPARRLELERVDFLFRIKGVMVDPEGAAIENSAFVFDLEGGGTIQVKTDGAGAFEAIMPEQGIESAKVGFLHSLDKIESKHPVELGKITTPMGEWIPLPRLEPGQVADLGSITLQASPVLVSGEVWVQGSSQAMVGTVKVKSLRSVETTTGILGEKKNEVRWPRDLGSARLHSFGGETTETKREVTPSSTRPMLSGLHFVIAGAFEPEGIEIQVEATGAEDQARYVMPRRMESKVGVQGLRIELVRAVEVRGLVAPASMDALEKSARERGLEARFEYRDGRVHRVPVEINGYIRGTVAPGLADVTIVHKDRSKPLAHISSLTLTQDGKHNERLKSIHLY